MFGGKSREEKAKIKSEKQEALQKQIEEMKAQKRARKESKRNGKLQPRPNTKRGNPKDQSHTIIKNHSVDPQVRPSQNDKEQRSPTNSSTDSPQQPGTVIRRPPKKSASQTLSEQEFRRQTNKITQQERYREIIARIPKNRIFNIFEMLNQSNDIFSFYINFLDLYQDDEIIIALGILDKSDVELFRYVKRNKLIDELYQGKVELYNKGYMQEERDKFFEFRQKYPQFQEDRTVLEEYLPHIYLLGKEHDKEIIDAMSLKTQVILLKTKAEMKTFEDDTSYKVVLLFKQPYDEVISEYLRIRDAQDFPIFSTFPLDILEKDQQIIPFNRDKLILATALK